MVHGALAELVGALDGAEDGAAQHHVAHDHDAKADATEQECGELLAHVFELFDSAPVVGHFGHLWVDVIVQRCRILVAIDMHCGQRSVIGFTYCDRL